MKRFLTVAAAMLALTGMGQVAMRKLEDLTNTNLVCVTDYGPQVVSLTQRVTGLEGNTNDWSKTVANLAALSNNVASLSSRVGATNALFSAWFSGLQSRTSYWNTAYSWGNHAGLYKASDWVPSWNDVTDKPDFATTQQVADVTAHIADTNLHLLAGDRAKIDGAITVEQDLAALRTYHYGSPDIVESPAEWFVLDGAGTITAFNWEAGRESVVIPWEIGGVPVTGIRERAFEMSGIVSVIGPQTVTSIGNDAFYHCSSLTSVTIPQATSIGDNTFYYCVSLTAVHMGQNAPAEATDVFAYITTPPTVYVTDPQATGWGATWNGAPVVRLPVYADALYSGGVKVATTEDVVAAVSGLTQAPTNAVSGWMVYDSGSNIWLKVTASNLSFTVWEVSE